MAKNKNRDHNKQAPSAAGRSSEDSRTPSTDDRTEQVQSRITPADVSPKGRQKRFGHN